LAAGRFASLRLRIVSALVLAPLAIAAVWLGSPFFPALVILAGAVMAWEWAGLCLNDRLGAGGILAILLVAALLVVASVGFLAPALVGVLAASPVLALVWGRTGKATAWMAGLGLLWVSLPCLALLWIAAQAGTGRSTVAWILAIVWSTDIGAYAFGKAIGGPRLLPRLSPNKTWAGLGGGVLCAALASFAVVTVVELPIRWPFLLAGGGLALVAQAGDLAESRVKRYFGVKDSSGLIPGHGGLLDRLDGMLAVTSAVAVHNLFGGSVLAWR
jgi:phosphatidate cytidylyltransferase